MAQRLNRSQSLFRIIHQYLLHQIHLLGVCIRKQLTQLLPLYYRQVETAHIIVLVHLQYLVSGWSAHDLYHLEKVLETILADEDGYGVVHHLQDHAGH